MPMLKYAPDGRSNASGSQVGAFELAISHSGQSGRARYRTADRTSSTGSFSCDRPCNRDPTIAGWRHGIADAVFRLAVWALINSFETIPDTFAMRAICALAIEYASYLKGCLIQRSSLPGRSGISPWARAGVYKGIRQARRVAYGAQMRSDNELKGHFFDTVEP